MTLLGVVALITLLLLISKNRSDNKAIKVAAPEQTQSEKIAAYHAKLKKELEERSTYSFTPDQLVQLYSPKTKNLADLTYTNKRVYVTGKVKTIETDALGKSYVLFASHDEMRTVQTYLATDAQARSLSVGQDVTIAGLCKGIVVVNVVLTEAQETMSRQGLQDMFEKTK